MKIVFLHTGFENLGIEYLSAFVKARGHQVGLVLDPCLFDDHYTDIPLLARLCDSHAETLERVEAEQPDIIGLSVVSPNFPWALKHALDLKARLGVPIVLGGIHPSSVPERVLKHDAFDFVIRGDGEAPLADLLDALASGSSYDDVPGLCYKKNGEIVINPMGKIRTDLDSLPFPDKDLYFQKFPFFQKRYLIVAARGCPYNCAYCNNNVMRKVYNQNKNYYRVRSVDNVIAELEWAKSRYDIEFVIFQDDLFCTKKDWLTEFCRRYRREIGIPFKLLGFHPSITSDFSVKSLREAGCVAVHMGIQSLNKIRREQLLGRQYTNDRIEAALDVCRDHDMEVITDFILGLPGETEAEILELLRFQNRRRLNRLDLFWLSFYPKSDIVYIAQQKGMIDEDFIEQMEQGISCTPVTGKGATHNRVLSQMYSLLILTTVMPRSLVELFITLRLYRFFPDLQGLLHKVGRLWKMDFKYDYNVKLYLEANRYFLQRKIGTLLKGAAGKI